MNCRNGKHDVKASLDTARTLYLTATDHADQLVDKSLPAIVESLQNSSLPLDVHRFCFLFLHDITKRTPHSIMIANGVSEPLVGWLK